MPGKGAIVVQARSNYFARIKGVEPMHNNVPLSEILKVMKNEKFDPEHQQYGLINLDSGSKPLVYSGAEITDWNGEKLSDDFVVMGNILYGKQVVLNTYKAFDENKGTSLSERLILALKAGEEAGGDKKCGSQYARLSFLMVYKPQDGAILKLSIQGIEKSGKPAVSLLNDQFALWRKKEKSE